LPTEDELSGAISHQRTPKPSPTTVGNHKLSPQTLMLGYGFDPELSEGSLKPPIFLTSTFGLKSADARKR
jgi:methionine-gamma-lyase